MKVIKTLFPLLFLLILSFNTQAQTSIWVGGNSGSYIEPLNWSPSGIPVTADTVVFDNGIDVNITDVPNDMVLAGLRISPNFSTNPTNVYFNFVSTGNSINLNALIIGVGCSLAYVDPANITVNDFANFNGGTLNINTNITLWGETNINLQNTILAHALINQGTINLNAGELFSDCILDNNAGTINMNEGTLIINKEFHSEINGFLYGGVNANLIFNASVTYVDPLPPGLLDLNSFIYHAPIPISLTGNLRVWDMLKLSEGELIFIDHQLTLYGDVLCEGGVLGCNGLSALNIEDGGTGVQSNLVFNNVDTDDRNTLNSLNLNRASIINIESDLIISDNLNLANGKLRISYGDIHLFESISVSVTNVNYIITGESGTVSSVIPVGNFYMLPVGSESSYAPVNINPVAANLFHVSVKDFVYSNGYDGDILLYGDLINLTWDIQTTASSYDMQLGWQTGAAGPSYVASLGALYNFDGMEWVDPYFSVTNTASGTITVNGINTAGLFMVASHQNVAPVGGDKEVITSLDVDYIFKSEDFPITDENGDELVKVMITQIVNDGILYLDYDGSGNSSADEEMYVGSEILYSDISTGKFRYVPSIEGVFDFWFKVSDGLNYSITDNKMTIVVGTNIILADDQSFYIPELSPNGTEVGQIQAIEIADEIIFEVVDYNNNADAFEISSSGLITVSNSSLLDKAVRLEFKYFMQAVNSVTDEVSEFVLTIILTDGIFVANYISPNGDGINDTWIVRGKDSGQYNVTIFDKRGNLVYRAENYMNDWHGTNNGVRLSPGVYYYIVRSDNIEEKGTITLVR